MVQLDLELLRKIQNIIESKEQTVSLSMRCKTNSTEVMTRVQDLLPGGGRGREQADKPVRVPRVDEVRARPVPADLDRVHGAAGELPRQPGAGMGGLCLGVLRGLQGEVPHEDKNQAEADVLGAEERREGGGDLRLDLPAGHDGHPGRGHRALTLDHSTTRWLCFLDSPTSKQAKWASRTWP